MVKATSCVGDLLLGTQMITSPVRGKHIGTMGKLKDSARIASPWGRDAV
jgi:hypothetical protein